MKTINTHSSKAVLFAMMLMFPFLAKAQSVGINNTGAAPNPNAILDVESSTMGMLIPRMTTTERSNFGSGLGAADEGMTVYDEDTDGYWVWNGSAWVQFDMDPTNEYNISMNLNGNILELTDGGGTLTQDLTSLVNDNDADPTNEYNTSLNLNGSILELTDGGGTLTQDLSSLSSNDGDWDRSSGNLYPTNIGDMVGIGTSTPASLLHVAGQAQVDNVLTVYPTSASFQTVISAGSGGYFTLYTDALYSGTVTAPGTLWDGMTISSEGTTFGDISYNIERSGGWHYWLIDGVRVMRLVDPDLMLNGGSYMTTGADVAEEFTHDGSLEKGDVVMISSNSGSEIEKFDGDEGSKVFGVVSSEPGVLLNSVNSNKFDASGAKTPDQRDRMWDQFMKERRESHIPVALNGRTPCKVIANEPIEKGDLLTASNTREGYAEKLTGSGSYFAVAMEDMNSGSGKIMVAIKSGYKGDQEKLARENEELKNKLDELMERVEELEEEK